MTGNIFRVDADALEAMLAKAPPEASVAPIIWADIVAHSPRLGTVQVMIERDGTPVRRFLSVAGKRAVGDARDRLALRRQDDARLVDLLESATGDQALDLAHRVVTVGELQADLVPLGHRVEEASPDLRAAPDPTRSIPLQPDRQVADWGELRYRGVAAWTLVLAAIGLVLAWAFALDLPPDAGTLHLVLAWIGPAFAWLGALGVLAGNARLRRVATHGVLVPARLERVRSHYEPLGRRTIYNCEVVYTAPDGHDHRESKRVRVPDGAPPSVPTEGRSTRALIDPHRPSLVLLPQWMELDYHALEDERPRQFDAPPTQDWRAATPRTTGAWPLSPPASSHRRRGLRRRPADTDAQLLLTEDALTMRWARGDVELRWDRPFSVLLTVWLVAPGQATLHVTLRPAGARRLDPVIGFAVQLPQRQLSADLPLKREVQLTLDADAFGALWPELLARLSAHAPSEASRLDRAIRLDGPPPPTANQAPQTAEHTAAARSRR